MPRKGGGLGGSRYIGVQYSQNGQAFIATKLNKIPCGLSGAIYACLGTSVYGNVDVNWILGLGRRFWSSKKASILVSSTKLGPGLMSSIGWIIGTFMGH
ncbi:hypothetical protein LguiB_033369 [Lonicera macranthoides]